MKKLLFTWTFLVFGLGIVYAQQITISGKLRDSTTQKPVEYATLALLKSGQIVDGITSDIEGVFVFSKVKADIYKLRITLLGYEDRIIDSISIQDKNFDVGTIYLSPTARKLNEITVTEQKVLFEEKSDRMVYNAEKDIGIKGGDATDVLRKIPSLSVDVEGNVQLRGSGNIKVLINNKPSSIVARSVSDALKQIPADIIKQVEVITSPSAKYDAEGTAGIINIITKKNALQGTNGAIGANFGQWNNWPNANITHRMKGLTLSSNIGFNDWKNKRFTTIDRSFHKGDSLIMQTQPQWIRGYGKNFFGNFNIDWDIDSLNRIGAGINYYNGKNSNNFDIDFSESYQNLISQYFHRKMNRTYDWDGATFNLDYTRTFKKPKRELNVLMMYSLDNENSDYLSALSNEIGTVYYREKSLNVGQNKEGIIQLDFSNPLDSISTLEMGTKAIFRGIASNYQVWGTREGADNYLEIPEQTNVFDYRQQVASAYMVYSRSPKKGWGINLGARYEHTFIQADFLNGTSSFTNSYGNVIPSASLSRSLKKSQQVRFSYSQRIQRPQFFYLNPYINQADSKNQYGGNPYLKPELTHSVEGNYSAAIKQTSFNASIFLRKTNHAIESVGAIDSTGTMKFIFQNVAENAAYGMNLSANTKITKKWSVNGTANFFYNSVKSDELNMHNADWMYRFTLNSTIEFGKGFKAQLFGFYNSPRVNLQGKQTGLGFYNMVIQKEILKKKATIGFGYDNPFTKTVHWRTDNSGSNFVQTQDVYLYRRGWRLNLKYEFGKAGKASKQKKRISNDDKKSGEGNN